MRECDDVMMQEALPAFRAGRLDAAEAETVRTHLATCDACALELELLMTARAVLDRATPMVDLARITAAATAAGSGAAPSASPSTEDAPRVITLRTRRWWASRQLLAAAASILVVVSLSIPALRGTDHAPATDDRLDREVVADAIDGQGGGAAVPSIDLAGGLADLSSAQLETFLKELDLVEATVRAEPVTIALPLIDAPESL
jgi:anti-sigma factor RsiW